MVTLTLEEADRIVRGAVSKGRELALNPLAVAVLDAGGCLVAFQRQDRASLLRPQIAIGKAAGALGLGVSSRRIGEMALERPSFFAALNAIAPQGVIPAAGGVLILRDGAIIGAAGVTGDSSDNDELCAKAGIAAAGFSVE